MNRTLINHIEKKYLKSEIKLPKPGMIVKVYQRIREGEKERVQIFTGLVIKINSGTGLGKSFTVRKLVEAIGVEKIFPLHSPTIEKIVVVKETKIRRAKLYFMRAKAGKGARLKEKKLYLETERIVSDDKTNKEEENRDKNPLNTHETAEDVKEVAS